LPTSRSGRQLEPVALLGDETGEGPSGSAAVIAGINERGLGPGVALSR